MLCADQPRGSYIVNATYDYACTLTKGHFIPPGFSPGIFAKTSQNVDHTPCTSAIQYKISLQHIYLVPECSFYAVLKYKHAKSVPHRYPPIGTGGGRSPRLVPGIAFDLTDAKGWKATKTLEPNIRPQVPDVSYTINMGLIGPLYSSPRDSPMSKGTVNFLFRCNSYGVLDIIAFSCGSEVCIRTFRNCWCISQVVGTWISMIVAPRNALQDPGNGDIDYAYLIPSIYFRTGRILGL